MEKKILLVKPSASRKNSAVAPPMGLLYLASFIKEKFGNYFDVKLIDMRIGKLSIKELSDLIREYNPDVFGCSACSEDDKEMHEIIQIAKKISRDTLTVVGGPHATMYYADILKDENIDAAVIGEGEVTFYELLRNWREEKEFNNIKGIAFRKDGLIHANSSREFIENLDILPFPAWDLIEIAKYSSPKVLSMNSILGGYKYMGLVTSRGCPYRCIYCHNIFGKRYRKRSAENVFEEIELLVNYYGIDEFHIYDDIFNLDVRRMEKICDLIINSNLKIKLAFPNGIRGDIINKRLLLKLKQAGAYMITFALESASSRIQKLIRKNIDQNRLLKNIKFADRIGLLTKCYFMIGFPTETINEIKETIDYACRSPLSFSSFFLVTPQKGTGLFELVKKYYPDFKIRFDSYCYYAENGNYENVIKKPLKKIQRYAYRRFFFNPKRVLKILIRMPRKEFLFRNISKFASFF